MLYQLTCVLSLSPFFMTNTSLLSLLTSTRSTAIVWNRPPALTYTEHTARCCDILQRYSSLRGDHILAWQVRLQRLVEETDELRRTQRGRSPSEYQVELMIRGIEAQLDEWEAEIARDTTVAAAQTSLSLRLATLFTRVFLSGAPLLKLPSARLPPLDASSSLRADPVRLLSVVPHLHALYDLMLALPPRDLNAFIGAEWAALVLSVILGFRMSFPLAVCPEWDDAAARRVVRFGEYIDRLCKLGEGSGGGGGEARHTGNGPGSMPGSDGQPQNMDVLSAGKVVLEVVRRKFTKRAARLEAAAAAQQQQGWEYHQQSQQQQQQEPAPVPAPASGPVQVPFLFHAPAPVSMPHPPHPHLGTTTLFDPTEGGCPIMDGSLEPYFPQWDETLATSGAGPQNGTDAATAETQPDQMDYGGFAAGSGMQSDLWAAMTMHWAAQADTINFEQL